jgi:uncharacterized protein YpuA (DUF1002 family)
MNEKKLVAAFEELHKLILTSYVESIGTPREKEAEKIYDLSVEFLNLMKQSKYSFVKELFSKVGDDLRKFIVKEGAEEILNNLMEVFQSLS